jgi:hypothetical protein
MKLVIASLVTVAMFVVGCSDFGGKSEGDTCGGSRDECGSNLTCQPINGHGSVCCPTPASASKESNCQASK